MLGEKLTRSLKPSKTKAKRRRLSFVDDEASAPLLAESVMSGSEQSAVKDEPVSNREIFTAQTSINLLSYTFLALHAVAYDQVLPVFLNYPRVIPDETNTQLPFKFNGGFGLSSDKIGTIYTVYGIACGVVQFLLFPTLCARFGVLTCYRTASTLPSPHSSLPPSFSFLHPPSSILPPTPPTNERTQANTPPFTALIFPLIYLLTPYTALIQDTTLRYALFLTIMLAKGFVVIIGFPCTTILLTNSASSLRILGTLNGFATTFSGLGRAVGPAAAGAVFSWGVKEGYAIAPWWMLAAIAMVGAVPPWFIVDGEGPTGGVGAGSVGGVEEEEEEEGGNGGERESLLRGREVVGCGNLGYLDDDEDENADIAVSDSEGEEVVKKRGSGRGYGTVNGGSR